jgi:hypothetical protein
MMETLLVHWNSPSVTEIRLEVILVRPIRGGVTYRSCNQHVMQMSPTQARWILLDQKRQ